MFLISKIFWLAAQPLSLVFLFLLLALIFSGFGMRNTQGFFSALAVILLFVTLFTSAGTVMLQKLEDRIARPASLPADLSCIIILGGAFENEVMASRGGIEFNQAADRFVEGLRLAQSHPNARILVSGGDGSFSGTYEGDAHAAETFFTTFGIPADRLIREGASRTTFENARNTRQLLEGEGLSNCALVTSAFHMPRSVGLFRKMGGRRPSTADRLPDDRQGGPVVRFQPAVAQCPADDDGGSRVGRFGGLLSWRQDPCGLSSLSDFWQS